MQLILVPCPAGGNPQQASQERIAAHRMVGFQNLQDLASKAGQTGSEPTPTGATCFMPPPGYAALDAVIWPDTGIQIHANADHDALSGEATAETFKVCLCAYALSCSGASTLAVQLHSSMQRAPSDVASPGQAVMCEKVVLALLRRVLPVLPPIASRPCLAA